MTKSSELFGGTVPFLGRPTLFFLSPHPFGLKKVTSTDSNINIALPGHEEAPLETGAKLLIDWLKSHARTEINTSVVKVCADYGLSYNRISIKDTRSRWGSCSARNNLNFNWRLILAPPNVLRYVVIHETAHLEQMNHSALFWNLVSQRCPAYTAHRKWLRQNGHTLLNWKPCFKLIDPGFAEIPQPLRCPEAVQTLKHL